METRDLTLLFSRSGRVCRPVYKLLTIPAYRDRVEEGGDCRSRPTSLLYRYTVEEIAVTTGRAVARKADRIAGLLARRAHGAVVVSPCFTKYTLSLHFAACIRRILEQRILLQILLSKYLPHRPRKLLRVEAALHLALNCHPVSHLAEHTVRA
jgi:hypothetical protein